MTKIPSAVLGASGESLVLSKLLLNGFIAGKAPEFTKDFDLVVVSDDGIHSAPIQVKTTTTRHQWLMSKKHEKVIENLIFCFVRISEQTKEEKIYLLDAQTVSHVLRKSHQIWLKIPAQKNTEKNNTNMRVLLSDYNKLSGLPTTIRNLQSEEKDLSEYLSKTEIDFLSEYSEGWMEKYEGDWALIKRYSEASKGVTGRDNKIIREALSIAIPLMLRHSLAWSNTSEMMRILEAYGGRTRTDLLNGRELKELIIQIIDGLSEGDRHDAQPNSPNLDDLVEKYLADITDRELGK